METRNRARWFSDNTGKMLGAAALLMAAVLTALLCDGLIRLSKDCRAMAAKQYPVSEEEVTDRVVYLDHLYFNHGFVLKIPAGTEDASPLVQNLLEDVPEYVSADLFNGIVAYSTLICTVGALFLYGLAQDNPKKHLLLILLAPVAVVAPVAAVTWGVSALCGLKLPFPSGAGSDFFFIGLISLMAGGCAVGLLLRAVPFKKIAALALIPVVLFLMMWVNKNETGLFHPADTQTVQLAEQTDIQEGKEADRDTEKGGDSMTAGVLTALFPFSGCDLWLVYDEGMELSPWAVTLIMAKNVFWFGLAVVLMTTRRRNARHRRAVS